MQIKDSCAHSHNCEKKIVTSLKGIYICAVRLCMQIANIVKTKLILLRGAYAYVNITV